MPQGYAALWRESIACVAGAPPLTLAACPKTLALVNAPAPFDCKEISAFLTGVAFGNIPLDFGLAALDHRIKSIRWHQAQVLLNLPWQ